MENSSLLSQRKAGLSNSTVEPPLTWTARLLSWNCCNHVAWDRLACRRKVKWEQSELALRMSNCNNDVRSHHVNKLCVVQNRKNTWATCNFTLKTRISSIGEFALWFMWLEKSPLLLSSMLWLLIQYKLLCRRAAEKFPGCDTDNWRWTWACPLRTAFSVVVNRVKMTTILKKVPGGPWHASLFPDE